MITARRQPEARGVAQVEEQVKVTKKYVDVLREQNKLDLDHLEQMVRNYARVREVTTALAAMPRGNPALLSAIAANGHQ